MGKFQLNKKGDDPIKIYEDTFKVANSTVETHLDKLGRMPKPISESKASEGMSECPHCDGKGSYRFRSYPPETCGWCRGTGKLDEDQMDELQRHDDHWNNIARMDNDTNLTTDSDIERWGESKANEDSIDDDDREGRMQWIMTPNDPVTKEEAELLLYGTTDGSKGGTWTGNVSRPRGESKAKEVKSGYTEEDYGEYLESVYEGGIIMSYGIPFRGWRDLEENDNPAFREGYNNWLDGLEKDGVNTGVYESKAKEVNGKYIINGMVIGKVTDFEPNNWFGKVELSEMPEFAEYGTLDPQAVVKGDDGVTYTDPKGGSDGSRGTLFNADGSPKPPTVSWGEVEAIAKEAISENEKDEMFQYLFDLQDSGITNMFGAGPYVEREFPHLDKKEVRDVVLEWMSNYEAIHARMGISRESRANERSIKQACKNAGVSVSRAEQVAEMNGMDLQEVVDAGNLEEMLEDQRQDDDWYEREARAEFGN